VRHHGAGLLRLTGNRELVQELSQGSDFHRLTPERAMLRYACELTLDPGSITEEHIIALRASGLSDRTILEINLAASYINFVNRIAEGLGVEIEPSLAAFHR